MSNRDPLLEPTPPSAAAAANPETTRPVKLCLVIVFNHHFDANLPKLDWLYRGQFEHIRYLMPFYRGDRPDVIAVHHSSFQFQGFFTEAWKRLQTEGFTHYLFSADDLVINPRLNDKNFLASLRIGWDDGYFKDLTSLADRSLGWFPTASALVAAGGKSGVNWPQELPSIEDATANLQAKGFPPRRLGWHNFRGGIRMKGLFQFLFYLVLRLLKRRRDGHTDVLGLPYPLLSGNADLMLAPASAMEKFTFYCSVFAAMGVFVEVAAPTALVLACPRVVCEADNGGWVPRDYFLGLSGPEECEEFYRQQDYDLGKLLSAFDARTLCLHPIKLSQWHYPDDGKGAAKIAPAT